MNQIAISLLALIALATGGCSLYFLVSFGDTFLFFAGLGVLVAALCLFGTFGILRSQAKAKPPADTLD